jgi:chitin disaccharide deacetylase
MTAPLAGGGLLIVNADDWGIDDPTTDAILATFQAGLITSTTGMVYMAGSDRAAGLAAEHGVPVGLHINLTEPFSDPATPPEVRARQQRMVERLGKTSGLAPELPGTSNLMRWIYDPRLRRDVDAAIADQARRFAEIYATPPTHFDGHTHVDLCPNVFLSRAIPRGAKVRNTLDRFPVERSAGGVLRDLRQAVRSRRFASTRYLLHITHLRLDRGDLDPRLDLARQVPVEVMAHPGFAAEREILMSPEWAEATAPLRLGSFADFDAGPLGWRESFRLLPA